MTKSNTKNNEQNTAESKSLGKIDIAKVPKEDISGVEKLDKLPKKFDTDLKTREKSLIEATRLLLREYGLRKSGAAVRDAVDTAHEIFSPAQTVNALTNFGFKSSFGGIKITKLTDEHFPLIAFKKMAKQFFANPETLMEMF